MNTATNIPIESNLRRIERASSLLRAGCTVLLVFAALGAIAASVSSIAGRGATVSFGGQSIAPADLTVSGRMLVGALSLITGFVMVKALHHLRRLLGNYSRREIFTADSAAQIRQFGFSCILWGAVKIVWAFVPLMVLSHRPPNPVSITIDSVVIGAVIVVISWFAEMAATLRAENDLTI